MVYDRTAGPQGYNRKVKVVALLTIALALAGCRRDIENKEAVRQAVIDYLSTRSNLNIGSMNVDVTSVSFKQNEAEAVVAFAPKGPGSAGQGMSMRYTLEKKGNRWAVKSRADSGQSPHGGAAPPGAMPGAGAPKGELPPGHPTVGGKK